MACTALRWRVVVLSVPVALALAISARVVLAALAIDAVSAVPGSAPVGVATPVVVTATILEPSVLPDGVNLQRLDALGRMVAVLGTLHDDGLAGDATAGDRIFSHRITVFETAPGPLRLRVSAAFRGSLLRALSPPLTVNITGTATGITILSPASLAYLNTSPLVVSGTVGDPTATVTVNGTPAAVSNGTFQQTVPLVEGTNTLTAVAQNSGGTTSTSSVQVTLDTTPPRVTIEAPEADQVTTASTITVAGTVNDIVVGTVNTEQATVTVEGVAAVVANRSFLASTVPLALGVNTLHVVGRDRAGNQTTAEVAVRRVVPTRPFIRLESGNNQSAAISAPAPAPLVVSLRDSLGNPVANQPVVFQVTDNDGKVQGATGGPAASVAVTTTAAGLAQVTFRLGARSGAGSNRVEATAPGFEGIAAFTATGTPTGASLITVDAGNAQTGALGEKLAFPFVAVVTDTGFNRIGGVPVTFTVKRGGGNFGGLPSLTMATDPDGRAAATLTLGTEPGFDNNVIEASFSANRALPATFTATAKTPGNAANTRITGVVLDNSNQPIAGVTMRLFLTHQGVNNNTPVAVGTPVQTDAAGVFAMQPVPVGFFKLMADGSTVAAQRGVFPTLEYDIVTVSGQENTLGMPVYLPVLDVANQLCVSETQGGTLTLPQVPGFALTVGAGTATFPGGSRMGCISVSAVNADKVPMAPGFGQQPRFIVTIQPVGTQFNGPAPITMPNVDGLLPGQVTELYSYDHDLAAFTAIGTGTVSADGLLIKSDPGVGILKAGWHCGGNPNSTGTVAPINVTASPTEVTKAVGSTFSVSANGTPPLDGVYSWEIVATVAGDDTGAFSIVSGPPCASATSCTSSLRGVRAGQATLRVRFRCTTTNAEDTADVRVNIVTAVIDINSTPAEDDDITAVTPAQTIPVRITLQGGAGTVQLSVSPAGRGTLDRTSLTLAAGASDTVTLTPASRSVSANDVFVVATIDGTEAAREDMTIVNVAFPAIRRPNTPAGMGDRIPPRVDTAIQVTVEPDLTGSGQRVTLASLNTSATNGNFTIGGAATFDVLLTGNVNLRGSVQTAATGGAGGGNAGNLRVVARIRGVDAVQSNGFSVAALAASVTESLNALVSTPGVVGIIVNVSVNSDSGVQGDLDQVDFSEQIQVHSETGSLIGLGGGLNSSYLPAVGAYADTHSTGASWLTGPGVQVIGQTHTLRDRRMGVVDIAIPQSGYSITRTVAATGGVFRMTTTKAPAAATANGFSAAAGLSTGGAMTGTQP
jgi:hypothetical protein